MALLCSLAACFFNFGMEFLLANSVAILRGLIIGKSLGLLPCGIELDVGRLVDMINERRHLNFSGGNVITDIISLLENYGIPFISLGRKGSNSVATLLARQAIRRGYDMAWKEGIPCHVPS